jgi:hypothetical protein
MHRWYQWPSKSCSTGGPLMGAAAAQDCASQRPGRGTFLPHGTATAAWPPHLMHSCVSTVFMDSLYVVGYRCCTASTSKAGGSRRWMSAHSSAMAASWLPPPPVAHTGRGVRRDTRATAGATSLAHCMSTSQPAACVTSHRRVAAACCCRHAMCTSRAGVAWCSCAVLCVHPAHCCRLPRFPLPPT